MPRPTWEKLPEDAIKVPGYIDEILEYSSAQNIKNLLANSPKQRDLDLRPNNNFEMKSVVGKHAAAIHQRGEVLQDPCESCKEDGPAVFKECIRMLTEQSGKCTNCIFLRKTCSVGSRTQHPQGYRERSRIVVSAPSLDTQNRSATQISRSEDREVASDRENQVTHQQTLNQKDTSNTYKVLGDLLLPRPTGKFKEKAEVWERELQKLDNRNMKDLENCPIIDLHESFREFQDQEISAWKMYGKDKSPVGLVEPSGRLDSSLAWRLHQPSDTSLDLENGQKVDLTSMIKGAGYHPDNLLFSHIHRHTDESGTCQDEYPKKVLECHEQFSDNIASSMMAKVEVLFGSIAQKHVIKRNLVEILPLWGEFHGLLLLLCLEKGYSNPDNRYKLRRVMLAAHRPEIVFYQGDIASSRQEKIMIAAIRMSGDAKTYWENGYYSRKLWLSRVSNVDRLHESEANTDCDISSIQTTRATTILRDNEIPSGLDQDDDRGAWDDYLFLYRPYSNEELRDVIPQALIALGEATLSPENWRVPTDLPEPVQKWLRGQRHVLFPKTPISSFQDFTDAISSILNVPTGTESIKELIEKIIARQSNHLTTVKGAHQQFWHSRFDGSVIEVVCKTCGGSLNPDSEPRWSVMQPGAYFARQRRCSACSGQERFATPKCQEVATIYIKRAGDFLFSKSKITESPITGYLREKGVEDLDLPSEVECWCSICTDKTTTKDGSGRFYDKEPRWTIGDPLYLERQRYCETCASKQLGSKHSTFFVPTDEGIASISQPNLMKFHKSYASLGRQAHEALLTKQFARQSSRKRKRDE